MGTDIQETISDLARFSEIIQDVLRTLDQAEAWIEGARQDLASIDDDAARQARFLAGEAADHIRNVHYGFLNDYTKLSQELSARLRA